jgi:RNA polymerase sigma-70 factor (ECF subfamily)
LSAYENLPLPAFRQSHAVFQSTHWSVVLRAGAVVTDESRNALEQLCGTYWYPLYAYARRRGESREDAMDMIQGFFASLLEQASLESVTPEKGRFRAFLLAALKNFMNNQWRHQNAQKRGGDVQVWSMNSNDFEDQYRERLSDDCTPDTLFDRCWVDTLLTNVIKQLEADYRVAARSEIFQAICPYLAGGLPRKEIAEQLKMTSEAVAMSLHRMRKRYGEILRSLIVDTVDDPNDVENEFARLMEIVATTT